MPTLLAIQCVLATTPKVPAISGRVVNMAGLPVARCRLAPEGGSVIAGRHTMSISTTIAFVLSNLPAILLVLALAIAALGRDHGGPTHQFLDWILLLPIGVTGLWAALGHLVFPVRVASYIGWQPSPFQFEVGMADLAIGVVACIAFRSDLLVRGRCRLDGVDLLAW